MNTSSQRSIGLHLRPGGGQSRSSGKPMPRPPGLSGSLWPMHPRPLPDELLSSWMVRIARAHGSKPILFWKRQVPFLNFRTVDRLPGEALLRLISAGTGDAPRPGGSSRRVVVRKAPVMPPRQERGWSRLLSGLPRRWGGLFSTPLAAGILAGVRCPWSLASRLLPWVSRPGSPRASPCCCELPRHLSCLCLRPQKSGTETHRRPAIGASAGTRTATDGCAGRTVSRQSTAEGTGWSFLWAGACR